MHFVDFLYNLTPVFPTTQSVVGMDASNDQDFPLQFDFAGHLRAESTVAGIDAARFQRAPEGSGQSTAGRRHHIVQCGRMRRERLRRDSVVLGDLGVNSKNHRCLFDRQISKAHGASLSLNSYP
jgi:hypothetical protein